MQKQVCDFGPEIPGISKRSDSSSEIYRREDSDNINSVGTSFSVEVDEEEQLGEEVVSDIARNKREQMLLERRNRTNFK